MLKVGNKLNSFSATTGNSQRVSLQDYRGKNLLLYFYPKDNTAGCTTEGQDFRDAGEQFDVLNTVVLGVSRDSPASHLRFATKHQFNFDLLSDEDESLCRQFDVIHMKKLYGREYLGIERSSFLIDAQGILRREWRKVRVKGHVEAVLQAIAEMEQESS